MIGARMESSIRIGNILGIEVRFEGGPRPTGQRPKKKKKNMNGSGQEQ